MSIGGKKKILLISFIFCCCFIAVGYFFLIHNMIIKGNIKVEEPKWEVKFKNITTEQVTGSASNYKKPELLDYVINFYAYFKEPDDSIEYEITVKNSGNLNAKLTGILLALEDPKAIKYEVIGINNGYVLKKGNEKTFRIKLTYTGEVTDNNSNNTEYKYTKLILNWNQAV